MPTRNLSEQFFAQYCSTNGLKCEPIPTGEDRTPDYRVWLGDSEVICEIKQIDPSAEDLAELKEVAAGNSSGRYVPNRLRSKLKNVSGQLKAFSLAGVPTLVMIYDNTPFKIYTLHSDVAQAMFGHDSISIGLSTNLGDPVSVSDRFFGGNRGLTPTQNTAVSAVAILDGGPVNPLALRIYHNPYARVHLAAELFVGLPATQPVPPGATEIAF